MKEVKKLSLERVFKALTSLGLSESDARVYMFLALKGPTKTGNIVNDLKMSRQQIHRSLKFLQDKRIVFADRKNQDVFSALLFEKALELLIETEEEKTEILQETKKSILQDWKTSTKKKNANC
jgi:sugar-specific transcriptional regulator TrmB